jgi:uncharacterized protein YndB with AHSA1/START domain
MNDTHLSLERLIPIAPDELFDLWTDPVEVAKWWAPEGFQCVVDALDTQPGGRWRTVLQRPDGGSIAISGHYRSVDRPRRLIFTWAWEGPDGERGHETEVNVSFERATGGTRLVLTQQSFEHSQGRDRHHLGWSACLDRITSLHAKA